ncbi:MAG: NUDIX hydrolase [Bryobacteraceae bacterium]|nr:NUDIX hydrolase [Bryobacteraceae bacterium]
MKITESRELLRTPIFWVTQDHAEGKKGRKMDRAVVRHGGSAVVMPVDDRKRVLLVRQYRLPANKALWEVPAGRLDPGESPLQAAKRELREETGIAARKWTRLAEFWASPGFLAEKMSVYLAQDLRQGEAEPMDDEEIETRWFTVREMEAQLAAGRIQDAKTLVAYLLWRRQKPKAE